ncbi:response regulator transcription factor [Clostridium botulinum]|uniref:Stage 0 sporulation protein A homolog n=1 Tax=Clostridium botulinum (strain Langeland / NCTC 10281 / Type F) TaxID=441772 RepID=A7GD34_CLOBL|nr:response regulator transcription factor [Clostridium botulinum]ABS39511.1 DNA-binding response regulator [Clostridium botulinum F str. Langeland]ADF99145.1 DNA-binding response regulator [Clostridium botulinum F str. 230613]KKM43297.1 chemotaxis protein CheY [Clostridium botulinum]MBD5643303.1 response regulator transcription factor [Clostridium botulinum]MBY6791185.1 response regulator transcription factor [Clostridium botulinum]
MRLLIIEDNIELANSMKMGLEKMGFHIDVSNTGSDGEEKASINEYDVILLDLNLPDIDGIEILNYLRSESIETPVIIVTARDEVEQLAFGLDNGADDYITKPFKLLELRARIHAIIRRFHGRTNPIINIGNFQLNPITRTVEIENKPVALASKEFDILEYICYRHPAVVSSEEIAEHIYDENFDPFSSVLRVHIARLKKKLSNASGKEILINIRGKGYVLCIE